MKFYIYKEVEADDKDDVVVPEGFKVGEAGVDLLHTYDDDEIIIPNWFNRSHCEELTGTSFQDEEKWQAFRKWIGKVEPDAVSDNIREDYPYFIEEYPEYAD